MTKKEALKLVDEIRGNRLGYPKEVEEIITCDDCNRSDGWHWKGGALILESLAYSYNGDIA